MQPRRLIWTIVVSTIVTATIVGSVVYVWQKSDQMSTEDSLRKEVNSLQTQIDKLQKSSLKEVQQKDERSEEVVTGISIYRNLGFEVSYPKTWIIDKRYESQGSIYFRTPSRQKDMDENKIVRVFDVMVKVYKSPSELPNNDQDKLSFEDWITRKADEYGFIERSPIMIDGVQGYKGVGGGMVYGGYLLFVENNGKIYKLEIEGDITEEKMNIVESFKFIK